MNIRSLSNPAQVLAQEKVDSMRRDIKSDHTTERDANGQQPFRDPPPRRPLTDEELEQVLDKLRNHEGIQRHQLQVNLYVEGDQKIVKIESNEGQIVKRLLERDLFDYLFGEPGNNFHLVKRTA